MSTITKVILDVTNTLTVVEILNSDGSATIHELTSEETSALWFSVPTEPTLYDCVKKVLVEKLVPEGYLEG